MSVASGSDAARFQHDALERANRRWECAGGPGYDADLVSERPEGAEVLDSNAHFVLMADEDGYSIWRAAPDVDDPDAIFPLTDEGSEQAWEEFRRLTSEARRVNRALLLPKSLRIIVLIGAAAWMGAGLIYWLTYALDRQSFLDQPTWLTWDQVIDGTAYRVGIGALAVLVALWIERRWRSDPSKP